MTTPRTSAGAGVPALGRGRAIRGMAASDVPDGRETAIGAALPVRAHHESRRASRVPADRARVRAGRRQFGQKIRQADLLPSPISLSASHICPRMGFLLTSVHELRDEPFEEIRACRADRLHQRYLAIAEMRMIYLDVCVAVAAIRHFETW